MKMLYIIYYVVLHITIYVSIFYSIFFSVLENLDIDFLMIHSCLSVNSCVKIKFIVDLSH